MANSILVQILSLINSGSTLEQAVEAIVPGADVTYWQRLISRQENKQQKPRKPSTRRTSNGKPRKTFNYALQTLARTNALAELTGRVNSVPADGLRPDPQGSYEIIINGEPTLWADTEEDARRMYDDYYTPRPITWVVNGQSVELEA